MKHIAYLVMVVAVICWAPIYAQNAFPDVPGEHWAYDVIESLQEKGIIQGYPDGTFQGTRTTSRYELATMLARLLKHLPAAQDTSNLVTKEELAALLAKVPAPQVTAPAVDLSPFATKDDVAAIGRLVDEFKGELQSLGIDLDQVKRDLAALSARVDAIEAELRRIRFTGTFDAIGKANFDHTNPLMVLHKFRDIDFRRDNTAAGFRGGDERDINVLRNFDLNLAAKINDTTSAMATITFGNYINYLNSSTSAGSNDAFVPYYMCIDTDLGFGNLTVGRFPLQLSPYTFKMPDADSYVYTAMTDSGNRPVDGAMLKTGLLGIDWTWFAAQHEKVPSFAGFGTPVYGVPFTQSAGVQLGYNAPADIRLGATYYQGWDKNNYKSTTLPDTIEVFGADAVIPIRIGDSTNVSGSWAQARQEIDGVRVANVDNQAWEYRLATSLGNLKVGAGYRDIGKFFAAPGAWDKIGYVNNPVNFKGFNGDLAYNLNSRLNLSVGGEFAKIRRPGSIGADYPVMAKNDEVNKYFGAAKYLLSSKDDVTLSGEYVVLDAQARPATFDEPTFLYMTMDYNRKLGDNAKLSLRYQLIEHRAGLNGPIAADTSYFGSVGVAQVSVSF